MYKQIIITLLLRCLFMICGLMRQWKIIKTMMEYIPIPPNYRHPSLQSASSRSVSWDLIIIVFLFLILITIFELWLWISLWCQVNGIFFLYILLRIPSRNWSPSRHHLQFHTHRIITTLQTQIIMEFCFFCLSTIKFSNIWCSLLNYKSFRLCGLC